LLIHEEGDHVAMKREYYTNVFEAETDEK